MKLAAAPGMVLAMSDPVDVLILRDPRESPKKCSLIPLRGTPGVVFAEYRADRSLDASGRVLLDPAAEPISAGDRGLPLVILDSSWRRLRKLSATVVGEPRRRRLPPLKTAYPRRSRDFVDPSEGLASVEALYAALVLLGHEGVEYLLDDYRWKDQFLELNAAVLGRGPL